MDIKNVPGSLNPQGDPGSLKFRNNPSEREPCTKQEVRFFIIQCASSKLVYSQRPQDSLQPWKQVPFSQTCLKRQDRFCANYTYCFYIVILPSRQFMTGAILGTRETAEQDTAPAWSSLPSSIRALVWQCDGHHRAIRSGHQEHTEGRGPGLSSELQRTCQRA